MPAVTADAKATRHDWTVPGVYPVAPGVHRVPLPLPSDGLRAVNVYVVEDGGGLVLIDSGWALEQARTALTAALAALGAGLGDVRSFLVTHVHRDHYTLAVQLRREFGSAVSLGLGEQQAIAALSGGTASPFAPQLAELRASGAVRLTQQLGDIARSLPGDTADWEAPDRWLTPHQEIGLTARTLTAIATPGHTRGHMVFRDAAGGLLFAGRWPFRLAGRGGRREREPRPLGRRRVPGTGIGVRVRCAGAAPRAGSRLPGAVALRRIVPVALTFGHHHHLCPEVA